MVEDCSNSHNVTPRDLKWEVDEFHGKHEGLVVAEIELESEDQSFEKPAFIGDEVTDDPRYYNANM
jgi:CYTH domain-containing protein